MHKICSLRLHFSTQSVLYNVYFFISMVDFVWVIYFDRPICLSWYLFAPFLYLSLLISICAVLIPVLVEINFCYFNTCFDGYLFVLLWYLSQLILAWYLSQLIFISAIFIPVSVYICSLYFDIYLNWYSFPLFWL